MTLQDHDDPDDHTAAKKVSIQHIETLLHADYETRICMNSELYNQTTGVGIGSPFGTAGAEAWAGWREALAQTLTRWGHFDDCVTIRWVDDRWTAIITDTLAHNFRAAMFLYLIYGGASLSTTTLVTQILETLQRTTQRRRQPEQDDHNHQGAPTSTQQYKQIGSKILEFCAGPLGVQQTDEPPDDLLRMILRVADTRQGGQMSHPGEDVLAGTHWRLHWTMDNTKALKKMHVPPKLDVRPKTVRKSTITGIVHRMLGTVQQTDKNDQGQDKEDDPLLQKWKIQPWTEIVEHLRENEIPGGQVISALKAVHATRRPRSVDDTKILIRMQTETRRILGRDGNQGSARHTTTPPIPPPHPPPLLPDTDHLNDNSMIIAQDGYDPTGPMQRDRSIQQVFSSQSPPTWRERD